MVSYMEMCEICGRGFRERVLAEDAEDTQRTRNKNIRELAIKKPDTQPGFINIWICTA